MLIKMNSNNKKKGKASTSVLMMIGLTRLITPGEGFAKTLTILLIF